MAEIHNALGRATELVRGFRRAFGLTGPNQGVERVSETIYPTADLWALPEWNALRADRLLWGDQNAAAGGAGTRSLVQLFHDDPKSVCIVEEIHVSRACAIRIQYGTAVALANLSTQFGARDTRLSGWNGTRLFSGAPAAAVGTLRFVLNVTPFILRAPIVIHAEPGAPSSVVIDPTVDNTAIEAGFIYRVHPLFPGEDVRS